MNAYRLASGAVECDERGLFVGGIALVKRGEDGSEFAPGAITAINEGLSRRYGAPVDIRSRVARLSFIASNLQKGEVALAQIGALLLRLPDPPDHSLDSPQRTEQTYFELAAKLSAAGLLKDDDFESKHPRVGGPPNRAWFADKPKNELTVPPKNELVAQPSKGGWLKGVFGWLLRRGRFGIILGRFTVAVASKISVLSDLEEYTRNLMANPATQPSTGDVDADEIGAEKDPPKTLEELQTEPKHYQLGYDRHHIVEQNPTNIAKRQIDWILLLRKFGRAMIDDPSNIAWVPRRRHWKITAIYNSKEEGDPLGRLHRQVINQLDFAGQREAGLAALREVGVLK